MAASIITKYAILTRRTELRVHVSAEVPACDDMEEQTFPAMPGTLIRVFQSKMPSPISSSSTITNSATSLRLAGVTGSSSSNKAFSTVQVLDFVGSNPIFENLYECPAANLRKVSEDLWPYVISIAEPERRLSMLHNQEQCQRIIYLKPKDFVSVSGELFGKHGVRYDCIIRYIGLVHELNPVGYFFGLELLHLDSGQSPQYEKIPFAFKYTGCDPQLSIITTADWISQLPNEVKKKFSPLSLFNDTLEKVRTVIAPSSSTNEQPSNSSVRKTKKSKKKEPTAQFYETLPVSKKIEYSQQRQDSPTEMERRTLQHQINTTMDSTDYSTASSAKTISLTNDEYSKSIENYENTLERQHGSSNSSNTHIPQTHTPPASILKHGRSSSASGAKDNNASSTGNTTKPLNIMSLEDRDIIVIDKADIRESTRNEASVIVVDKKHQQDIDLADLLGTNWPHNAGDAASILNKTKQTQELTASAGVTASASAAGPGNGCGGGGGGSSNSSVSSGSQAKTDRNKSANPLSHLLSSSSVQRDKQQEKPTTDFSAESESYSAVAALANANENDAAACLNKYTNKGHEASSSSSPFYDNVNCDADVPMPAALPSAPVPVADFNYAKNSQLLEIAGTGLGVGSMVEVSIPEAIKDLYGVIRWIGVPPGAMCTMVGVELEDDRTDKQMLTTDGSFNDIPLFKCPEGRALFVLPENCSSDRRFVETEGAVGGSSSGGKINRQDSKMFGQVECPSVAGAVAPLKIINQDQLDDICGKFKGIQGHHNSCYLDATLFAMFTFTSVFDSLLFRPPEPEDIANYTEVQKVLREEIVNPLRKNVFVRADRVMKLRQLLDKLSSVSGLTSEEKDPEEFLNSLLAQIMRVEPFLKLSSGQDAYFYQLFVEKDERLSFPTVQQLFEQSFHSSDIKLKEVPSCLIIQMPRFGKNYKMYPRILPSSTLDVTDIIEDSPRQCSVCGKLAEYECRDCFGVLQSGVGLESTAFCGKCLDTVHMHAKRANHSSKKLSVPQDFRIMAEHMSVPRLYMELFAVVCIETSHYVAFVKAGSGPDAPWCFFDSMADRKGEQNGYNIPEMISVPDLPLWLSDEGARTVNETSSNDKMLPEHAKRLFCDAYMCMYQSIDVMMYR